MKRTITLAALAATIGLNACGGKEIKVYEDNTGNRNKMAAEDVIGISDVVRVKGDEWVIGPMGSKLYAEKDTLQLLREIPDSKPLIERAIKENYITAEIVSALLSGLVYRVAFWQDFARVSREDNLEHSLAIASRREAEYRIYLSILQQYGLKKYIQSLPKDSP